jgi:UDP-N-acetylglucosamine--N-acetylmuramyl-(pentapeptide) pyrophosphoryl-undecaprenol N-acetylglucosamine transferase
MKVLMTGTHFTPAQAVIEELRGRNGVELVYIGRKTTREGDKSPSVESLEIPKLGVKFIPIISGRLQRKFTLYTIPSLLKIPFGFIQSFYFLVKERPDVVVSFGGYLAVPVVISAWLLNIPIIVHEQTLVAGLANDISNFFADKVAVSFQKEYSFNPKKLILTGNPIREEILNPPKLSDEVDKMFKVAGKEKLPVILITGGNQGSHVINQAVEGALDELTKEACLIHQTGDSSFGDFEHLEEKGKSLKDPDHYLSKKWLGSDLGGIMELATLAVSRAGANTLLELAYFGVPALLIPIDFASRDEQNTNAKFFKDLGLAQVLPQSKLSPETLIQKIKEMLKNKTELSKSAREAGLVVIPDAAKRLAQEILLLAS